MSDEIIRYATVPVPLVIHEGAFASGKIILLEPGQYFFNVLRASLGGALNIWSKEVISTIGGLLRVRPFSANTFSVATLLEAKATIP